MHAQTQQLSLNLHLHSWAPQSFIAYHEKYPQVYAQFKKLALQTISKGFKRFSARGVFQVMRWMHGGQLKEDGFKYNNNYTPYYVRLFEQEHPQHKDFFEKRKTQIEG